MPVAATMTSGAVRGATLPQAPAHPLADRFAAPTGRPGANGGCRDGLRPSVCSRGGQHDAEHVPQPPRAVHLERPTHAADDALAEEQVQPGPWAHLAGAERLE